MSLQCWIYVCPARDPAAAIDTTAAVARRLDDALGARAITGYFATPLLSEADFEEQDIERELVEQVTGGSLPAVFLNVTYELDEQTPDPPDLRADLLRQGFQLALTDPAADSTAG